jgi:hypothetical protein
MGEESNNPRDVESLARRIDQLERENERLKKKVEPMFGPDNPWFDPHAFLRAVRRAVIVCTSPMYLAFLALGIAAPFLKSVQGYHIAGLPLVDFAGIMTRHPGFGLGIFAFGGAALGVVAMGGLGIGIIAVGGGSIGILAVGGGSFGLIAVGGGALGYIAVGGGAVGYYALGQNARGKYALGLNRQDLEAIAFFVPWVPGLRAAVTMPMPVIPLKQPDGLK